jgi:hypothetical protein
LVSAKINGLISSNHIIIKVPIHLPGHKYFKSVSCRKIK